MTEAENPKTMRVRMLNDRLRQTLLGGRVMITQGIMALDAETVSEITARVTTFTDFSQDNDPYNEHDFGAFDFAGQKIFWKIDYYDKECCMGSPDPADPALTTRVLTIFLASEY